MWDLKFTGESDNMSVNDFIFRVETLRYRHQLYWASVADNFHLLVAGRADELLWQHLRHNRNVGVRTSWEGIKQALLSQFKTCFNSYEIMEELMDLKQSRDESFDNLPGYTINWILRYQNRPRST